jgi:imidazolonepropionase-like amidohydrolase
MHKIISVCGLLALVVAPAFGQDRTYIQAGRLVDVVDGQLRSNQVIVINGERIERVGSNIDVPDGARVIDLGDMTVLPGLIDMHVHLTGDPDAQGYANLATSIPRSALFGVANGQRTMNAGFTTGRNVGAGHALGITGGHCDNNLLPWEMGVSADGVADGPWEIRKKIRENDKYGADLTKFCATGGVLSKGTTVGAQQYTLEEMVAIVDESHRKNRRVAAHAHGTEGIIAAITAGVDSVEHASMIDEEGIRLALANGTFLVMDVYVSTYILEMGEAAGFLPESLDKERQVGQVQRDNFRKAHEAGVRMAFGSDAGVYPHGYNGKQFAYMVQYGMTPMEAIQAATVNAAELLDWPGDVGVIEGGAYADIIAVDGNPLEDIRELEDVDFVMKGGAIFKQ